MGKSCQGTLKLAGHPEELQQKGYLFGKHLALAWQACLDREPFAPGSTGQFSLVSAPVLFALQHNQSMYSLIEKGRTFRFYLVCVLFHVFYRLCRCSSKDRNLERLIILSVLYFIYLDEVS